MTGNTGRVYIDYAAQRPRRDGGHEPLDARAPGAPLLTPIDWSEVTPRLMADKFNLGTVRARLARLRQDPWKEIGKIKQKLPAL